VASLLWSDVTALAPQLAVVDITAQAMILAYVNDTVNVPLFGGESSSRTKLVRVMLAAHFGELQRRQDQGQVIGETVGTTSIAIQYERRADPEALRETSYGAQYLGLINASAARVGFVP
jgi:hypothetical protein